MWVARDKNGYLKIWNVRPIKKGEYPYWCMPNECTQLSRNMDIDSSLYPELTWEDEPLEVELTTVGELLNSEKELKNVYHELLELQTKEIRDLNRVFRGVQLEEVSNIIHDIEKKIHSKYEMIGDISCSQNCRMVTIPHSSIQISDNSLREYIDDDKVVATIYVRRNDFNTADILVSDFGDRYNKLQE